VEYDVRITIVREMRVSVIADSMASAKEIAQRVWENDGYSRETVRAQQVKFETLYPDYTSITELPRSIGIAPYGNQGLMAANGKPGGAI
jgi:hypothetical protein